MQEEREGGWGEKQCRSGESCCLCMQITPFPLSESPPALHRFINTHLYPGPAFHLSSLFSTTDEEVCREEEEEEEVGGE